MIRFAVILSTALAIGAPACAAVAPVDVNQLLPICDRDHAACEGFIMGALGMHLEDNPAKRLVCFPRSATPAQLRETVVSYVTKHPETRSLKAAGVVALALHQAFPCP